MEKTIKRYTFYYSIQYYYYDYAKYRTYKYVIYDEDIFNELIKKPNVKLVRINEKGCWITLFEYL